MLHLTVANASFLQNSTICVTRKDECLLPLLCHSRIFNHIMLPACRTLGQYHHQTISASWSQSTKGEGLGAGVTSGRGPLFI